MHATQPSTTASLVQSPWVCAGYRIRPRSTTMGARTMHTSASHTDQQRKSGAEYRHCQRKRRMPECHGTPPEHGHTREHPPRNLPGKLDSATPTQQDPKSHKFCTSQPRERSWPLVRLPTAGATMAPRDMPPTTRRPMNMELEPVTRPYGSRTGPRMQSHADAGVVAEGLSRELGGAPNREVDRRHHKLGRGRASDRQKRWERGHAWIHPVCLRNASPNALRRSALCPNESGGYALYAMASKPELSCQEQRQLRPDLYETPSGRGAS